MPFGRGEFALSPVVRCWHSGRRSGSAFGRRDSDLTVERVTATVGAERFGGLANSWVAVRTLSRLLRSSTLTILLAFRGGWETWGWRVVPDHEHAHGGDSDPSGIALKATR
jgi:hypothetical protein